MIDFPECMKRRAEYEDVDGEFYGETGQLCHRIAYHDGNCLFDRAPEYTPTPVPTNFRTRHPQYPNFPLHPRLVPNPAAGA